MIQECRCAVFGSQIIWHGCTFNWHEANSCVKHRDQVGVGIICMSAMLRNSLFFFYSRMTHISRSAMWSGSQCRRQLRRLQVDNYSPTLYNIKFGEVWGTLSLVPRPSPTFPSLTVLQAGQGPGDEARRYTTNVVKLSPPRKHG